MKRATPIKWMLLQSHAQRLDCYQEQQLLTSYLVSTAKNGLGEVSGSECTPRGWHAVREIIGQDYPINSVFIARKWTEEIYSPTLRAQFPERDWILTRIIRLDGLEEGRNRGGQVDTYNRYIYIHGVPDEVPMGEPKSHGCIRMRNRDVMQLADWVVIGTKICVV